MSASLLSDSVGKKNFTPQDSSVGASMAKFNLVFGHNFKILSHVVSVGFLCVDGISFKSKTSFSHMSLSYSKISSVKSWAMPGTNCLIVGYGTIKGSFQLLSFMISSPGVPPFPLRELSHSHSGCSGHSLAIAQTPITWLDLKFIENTKLLLMIGQGSKVHDCKLNPYMPSFSLVHFQSNLSHPSLIHSCQSSGVGTGVFVAASLVKFGSKLHLAFAYWQNSLVPHAKVHHLSLDWASKTLIEQHQEISNLSEGDMPLDFHGSYQGFKLICSKSIDSFPLYSAAPQIEHESYSCNASQCFIKMYTRASSVDCPNPLALADMSFF
ncbi:hypothetical protein DSO57_1006578 [Entomophthora muscae]|uniref:Uncharacterized protein n=1 Tax=Entomophthora muscae TaxID=34485 RepID=A0ACC2TW66_9FUNG|nr:hypothetical protein DSO57_1006578 [Entomophthora muscae]